jgi:hypothetical protein
MSRNLHKEALKDFTEDHIQRLTDHNPGGIFTTILTAVTNAYNAFFGDMASESLNLAVKKGKTTAMNAARKALEKQLSENEKLVAYTYRNDLDKYDEFYPAGMTEYYNADLPTLETISGRYKSAIANHPGDFDPQFVVEYNTIQQTFIDNRAAQQSAKGNVDSERGDLVVTRADLAKQLTTNLLTIALQYVGEEEKCETYFNQAILNAAFAASDRRVEGEIDPGVNEVVFSNITKSTVSLMIENTGAEPLMIGFVETEDTPLENIPQNELPPGDERGTSAGQAGWTTEKRFLKIANYSGGVGSYIARKV